MTVKDLIELLQAQDPDAQVFMAQQPRWPFEYAIADVVYTQENGVDVVYLVEGEQTRYLPAEAARACGWGRG